MLDLRFISPGRPAVLAAVIVLLTVGRLPLAAGEFLPEEGRYDLQAPGVEPIRFEIPPLSNHETADSEWTSSTEDWTTAFAHAPVISLADFEKRADETGPGVDTVNHEQPRQPFGHNFDYELLPEGLMFKSYLAGEKEPRFAAQWLSDDELGGVWETALGGRWGILRYGSPGAVNPEGFQLDFEGGVMARVILGEISSPLYAADFRAGAVGTWHIDRWRAKTGYYHLSSHLGDEFLLAFPNYPRINYVRDAWLAAIMYDLTEDLQIYGEGAYALNANGGAEPGEFQFGVQFLKGGPTGPRGFPFFAINNHWRQEFSGELATSIQAGWMWRGKKSDHIFRVGFQHYNGRSMQYQFYNQYENLNGFAVWFDY